MSGEGPGSGLIWAIEAMLGGLSGILNRYDPKRKKGILKQVRFELPENDEVSVTYDTPDGSSTQESLYAVDIWRDFHHHGRHWLVAQEFGIESFEEYWYLLLGDDDVTREPLPVDIKVTPLFDCNRTLKQILVSFRYLRNGKLSQEFKEMSLRVPEVKDWQSKQAWMRQTAHIRCKHGNDFSIKIGDLEDFEYEAFIRAVGHVMDRLQVDT
ncbi:MAG: hypothetical protein Q9176_003962 [Flavoplaca citrina]